MPFLNVTEQEALILRSMIREFSGGARNAPQRNVLRTLDEDNPQAPECYIALASQGIPACEGSTGTAGPDFIEGDQPGAADCEIFRIIDDSLVSTGLTKRVFNLSSTAIDAGWIQVSRDKFGSWIAGDSSRKPIIACSGDYDTLPAPDISSAIDGVLGVSEGCIVLIPVAFCDVGTGS